MSSVNEPLPVPSVTASVAPPTRELPWVRGVTSIVANVIRGAVSFVTGLAVARALGAAQYGNLAFLLGSFAALAMLLDFGTTSAFYTMLASRPRGRRFFIVYGAWTVGVQFLAIALVIAFLLTDRAVMTIWPNFDRTIVLLSLTASFAVTQVWMTVTQMAEAVRKTVFIQSVATAQVLAHFALVLAAIYTHRLSLTLLLVLPIVEYVLLAVILVPRLLRLNVRDASDENFRGVIGEFAKYCKPLVAYSIVGFVYHFADRWFLQHFGGGTQQGFFAIGQQFTNIANLVTASILAVVWKEVAEAVATNQVARARAIFTGVRRCLFFIGAAVSCLLLPNAGLILEKVVGSQFIAATVAVSLMFLYPIHQSIGQFQGTFLLATGATTAYTAIGVGSMILSLPIAYALIASPTSQPPGLGWGATGLAVKLIVVQFLAVTAQFWILRREHAFRWQWNYEIGVLAALLALSFGLRWICLSAASAAGIDSIAAGAVTAAVLYSAVIAFVVTRFPDLVGVTADQRNTIVNAARGIFSRRTGS